MSPTNSTAASFHVDYVQCRAVGRLSAPYPQGFAFVRKDGKEDFFTTEDMRRSDWWKALPREVSGEIAALVRWGWTRGESQMKAQLPTECAHGDA